MKRLQWAITMVLLAMAQSAYADSVPAFSITNFSVPFIPDNGSGDNEFYFLSGPRANIAGSGTVRCFAWCGVGVMLFPGSSLTPNLDLVTFDSVNFIQLGGQMPASFAVLFNSSITALRSFSFPTNGVSTFTVTVPAVFNGPIQGQGDFRGFNSFNLNVPPGHLVLTFNFIPASNGIPANYQFSQGQFDGPFVVGTPEPGTLGLVASGLAGILGAVLRKRGCKRSAN
jgi:PEP-CTERM motif